ADRSLAAETLLQRDRRRDLELIVATVLGRLIGAPAHKLSAVPKPVSLHVVVPHFTDPLGPQRLPAQVLPPIPAAGGARQTLMIRIGCVLPVGPRPPGVAFEGILAQRRQLFDQLVADLVRESSGHADVVQRALI